MGYMTLYKDRLGAPQVLLSCPVVTNMLEANKGYPSLFLINPQTCPLIGPRPSGRTTIRPLPTIDVLSGVGILIANTHNH